MTAPWSHTTSSSACWSPTYDQPHQHLPAFVPVVPLLDVPKSRCEGILPSEPPTTKDEERCNSCLYTGVATCTGLSLYFLKMGLLDLPQRHSSKYTPQVATNQRFIVLFGGAWAVAGVYRAYLG